MWNTIEDNQYKKTVKVLKEDSDFSNIVGTQIEEDGKKYVRLEFTYFGVYNFEFRLSNTFECPKIICKVGDAIVFSPNHVNHQALQEQWIPYYSNLCVVTRMLVSQGHIRDIY